MLWGIEPWKCAVAFRSLMMWLWTLNRRKEVVVRQKESLLLSETESLAGSLWKWPSHVDVLEAWQAVYLWPLSCPPEVSPSRHFPLILTSALLAFQLQGWWLSLPCVIARRLLCKQHCGSASLACSVCEGWLYRAGNGVYQTKIVRLSLWNPLL